jgi:hypothetical protein
MEQNKENIKLRRSNRFDQDFEHIITPTRATIIGTSLLS